MKIDSIHNVKGRGLAITCAPSSRPEPGSVLRHPDGRAWLITAVDFQYPWRVGRSVGLFLRSRLDGQPEPVEGEEVEMIEPLDLLARLDALEAVVHRHHHACLGACGCSVCDWYVASRKASK